MSRLQRMLQETDDRLEKLQTEVVEVTTGSTTTPSLPPGSYCPPTVPISSPENSSEQEEESSDDSDFEDDSIGKIRHIWMPKVDSERNIGDEEDGNEPRKKPSTLFSLSPFGKFTPKINSEAEPDPRFDEAVVRLLTPQAVEALRRKLGLPPGLRVYLELEVARLQLGASLFHHSTVKCDRGCEGNDEESEISTSDDDDEDDLSSTTSWDDTLSEPSSNENEEDSSGSSDSFSEDSNDHEIVEGIPEAQSGTNLVEEVLEPFEPYVPERPRILSSSSSSSSSLDSLALPTLSTQFNRLAMNQGSTPNAANDEAIANSDAVVDVIAPDGAAAAPLNSSSHSTFFAFGETDEHQTISNYVQQMVQETFDHSTDSETD